MQHIAEQHGEFFATLRRIRAAGHDLVLLAGNHDQEILFPSAKVKLRSLLQTDGRKSGRFTIGGWFHLHGDALVEHGHRYEPLNNLDMMLHPFSTEGGENTLRAAAGSTFVADVVSGMRGMLPRNFRPKSGGDVFAVLRSLRPSVRKLVGLGARFADSSGPLSPEAERKLVELHHAELERIAAKSDVLEMLNETRARQGEPPITQQALRALLHQFDRHQARPLLRRKVRPIEKKTTLGKLLALFSPREWLSWIRPRSSSRLRWGQQFTLRQLANVVISGHTHHTYHYALESRSGERQHLANSGTWAGDRNYPFTFVEVRQGADKETSVRLREWNSELGRAMTIPAEPLPPGKIPSNKAVR